jgi:hypothetical protein
VAPFFLRPNTAAAPAVFFPVFSQSHRDNSSSNAHRPAASWPFHQPPETGSAVTPPSRSFLLTVSHLKRRRRRSPPNHQIYHRQKENKQRREKAEELDREKKNKIKSTVCGVCLTLQVTLFSLLARKGRGEEVVTDPLFVWIFWRRRVNPRAASGCGAWRRRAATVQATQRLHNTVPVTWGFRHYS